MFGLTPLIHRQAVILEYVWNSVIYTSPAVTSDFSRGPFVFIDKGYKNCHDRKTVFVLQVPALKVPLVSLQPAMTWMTA